MNFNKEKICGYCFNYIYQCEFCGFKFSSEEKLNYYICGCCGKKTTFNYDSFETKINNFKKELRRKK